jgi:ubiquinone/menaquinone biosynthesis C-methylase UbiE
MLARLEEKLRGSELQNISLLQGDATRVPLPDACCELVLFANLWHELPDHDRVIKEAIRLLSANGRIAILDWRAELDSPPGPPRHHRISAQSVSDTLQKHGCALVSNQHIGTFSHLVIASVVRFSSPVV